MGPGRRELRNSNKLTGTTFMRTRGAPVDYLPAHLQTRRARLIAHLHIVCGKPGNFGPMANPEGRCQTNSQRTPKRTLWPNPSWARRSGGRRSLETGKARCPL